MELTYIVPSRGRVAKVRELIESWADTRTTAHLVIVTDRDDPTSDEYRKFMQSTPYWVHWWQVDAPRTRGMVDALNIAAGLLCKERWDVIGFMGDDHRPRTHGWDKSVLDAMPGVVYANDLLQGHNLPTQVAMPARFVEALGYMAPPTFTHLYVDNFWKSLGIGLDCLRYLPDVVIEHMHPVAGKSDWDPGYVAVNSGETYQHDADAFSAFTATELNDAISRVRAVL